MPLRSADPSNSFETIKPEHNVILDDQDEELDDDLDPSMNIIDEVCDNFDAVDVSNAQPAVKPRSLSADILSPLQQLPMFNEKSWKAEVERVAPLLKVTLGDDNKDWRIHLQQLNAAKNALNSDSNDAKTRMNNIVMQIDATMEKINSREKYINSQLSQYIEKYNQTVKLANNTKNQVTEKNEAIVDVGNELNTVSEELEILQVSEYRIDFLIYRLKWMIWDRE
jgi:estrogen-related receptor beta like 1